MNKEEKLLCDLVEYFVYLKVYNKSSNWNNGYFRKLDKLLKSFCMEYTKNHWGCS